MRKTLAARREDQPGEPWRADFTAGRTEAERWYLGSGRGSPSSSARQAIGAFVPGAYVHDDGEFIP